MRGRRRGRGATCWVEGACDNRVIELEMIEKFRLHR